ncbi:hypothetical protein [Luteirhabdus pelagi]|uniref:hypothetical protein n=1 Tax=Luteirhabdus pelagi TaxID=2792783 RepID=UPI001F20CB00|nr:hypothetical protein [Luteirhabdus pelagi]
MKLLSKTLFLLLIAPAMVLASNGKMKGKYTKEKTIKRDFTVNADAGLRVNNSYGNLDITTWNQNKTVIEVTIKTNGNDEEKVKERLSEIDVKFTANGTLVSAETQFGKQNKGWSWWGGNKNNVSVEVNYLIKMPITNTVDLSNDYGAINISTLEGNAKISCDYGQIIIGELKADNNMLNFDYTDKSTIGYMKSGRINADYSGFTLERTESVEISADYTQSEIVSAKSVNYNCDYGKVMVEEAVDIVGRGDYVNNHIGTVKGSLNMNTDYGSIHVKNMAASAKDVTIRADYTGIKLGFSPGYHFDFVVDCSYSNLKGEEQVTVLQRENDHTDKFYKGYHGKERSGNTVNIQSDYGGVTFIKN